MKRFLVIFLAITLVVAVSVPAMAGGVHRYPPGVGYSRYGGGVQHAPGYGRGYHRGHYGGHHSRHYYGGTNRHSWEPVAVLAGAVVVTKILDGIFSSNKEVVVVQQAPSAGYGGYGYAEPNCNQFPTAGERNACEQGKAQTQRQVQLEREQRAREYGRNY